MRLAAPGRRTGEPDGRRLVEFLGRVQLCDVDIEWMSGLQVAFDGSAIGLEMLPLCLLGPAERHRCLGWANEQFFLLGPVSLEVTICSFVSYLPLPLLEG